MKYDWITIAIDHGGVLTTSKNAHGYYSTMNWTHCDSIRGDHQSTLPDAITALNSALEDDAAEVCSA